MSDLFVTHTSVSLTDRRIIVDSLGHAGVSATWDQIRFLAEQVPGSSRSPHDGDRTRILPIHPEYRRVCTWQHDIMDGLYGPERFRAWSVVRGHLLLRWLAGNFAKPRRSTVQAWLSAPEGAPNELNQARWDRALRGAARGANRRRLAARHALA